MQKKRQQNCYWNEIVELKEVNCTKMTKMFKDVVLFVYIHLQIIMLRCNMNVHISMYVNMCLLRRWHTK